MPQGSVAPLRRTISVTREGPLFRLAFPYDPDVVDRVRKLPDAEFDRPSKTWTAAVVTQTVDALRGWWLDGLLDTDPDELIPVGETLVAATPAVLFTADGTRPYRVMITMRDDRVYAQLMGVVGARWEAATRTVSFPEFAAAGLAGLVDAGLITDREGLFDADATVVLFDPVTARFVVRGDPRAQAAFDKHFPDRDVVGLWQSKGLPVMFGNGFSSEVYFGEFARRHGSLQPDGFKVELYDYQRNDVAVAVERTGCGVWSAMGVGKTPVALAVGHELMTNRQEVSRVLIVVPPAMRTQWRHEITKYVGVPGSQIAVIDGTKKQRARQYAHAKTCRWIVAHYNLALLDDGIAFLESMAADALLVMDEAHRLKGWSTKTTRAMRRVVRVSARRLALSGTPVETSPSEWFTLHNLLYPNIFGGPQQFMGRYAWPNRFNGFDGARRVDELRDRSAWMYVRHRFDDVAGSLPEMRMQTVLLEPNPAYAAALRKAHQLAAESIGNHRISKRRSAPSAKERALTMEGSSKTATSLLRLLCLSPEMLRQSDSESAKVIEQIGALPDGDGPKVQWLREMAAELAQSGTRVVVFTSSKRMVELVSRRFDEDRISHVRFTGGMKRADRDAAVAAFTAAPTRQDPGPTVFLATEAGAEGLNLGAQSSMLINLDLPWKPGALSQRNHRIRRIDSTATGFLVVNLVLAGTMEMGLLHVLEQRAALAGNLLGEEAGSRDVLGTRQLDAGTEALLQWARPHNTAMGAGPTQTGSDYGDDSADRGETTGSGGAGRSQRAPSAALSFAKEWDNAPSTVEPLSFDFG